MKTSELQILFGALLHDIGKIIFRTGLSVANHSELGFNYLKDQIGIGDQAILNCVRFHHKSMLKKAGLANNDSAYIVYIADNIASGADRRDRDDAESASKFDKQLPLDSIFNIFKGKQRLDDHSKKDQHFPFAFMGESDEIVYATESKIVLNNAVYFGIQEKLTAQLKNIEVSERWVGSLINILESCSSYVPSSTATEEVPDISLFDHSKITAAVALCIKQYLDGEHDLKRILFDEERQFYSQKAFLMYSLDISGIQNFIYTISSAGALKSLRSRSFYLEFLLEHIIDEILERLSLSRCNLIYSGGGHCYMLLPNTDTVKKALKEIEDSVNDWFIDNFDISLFIAGAYTPCSAEDLKNMPDGSFAAIYKRLSQQISLRKSSRYTAADLLKLNGKKISSKRECCICRRIDNLDDQNRCRLCSALIQFSKPIQNDKFFVVLKGSAKTGLKKENLLPLPFGKLFLGVEEKAKAKMLMADPEYVRVYVKNDVYAGDLLATHIWVGDYSSNNLDEYASLSQGIERIGVVRADVDDLGASFANGFAREYSTLSRMATLSRTLSVFFKYYINSIFKKKSFCIADDCADGDSDKSSTSRRVSIVYSGGDDVFIIGTWNDALSSFVDLRNAFLRFTQGTLSISGGLGLFPDKFPIGLMARDTEFLVESSKDLPGKDAFTLFDTNGSFKWNVFLERIYKEKFALVYGFLKRNGLVDGEHAFGKAFLYRLLELLRSYEKPDKDRINVARLVYLLSRMEPRDKGGELYLQYRSFADGIYKWHADPEERRELIYAIYLCVYCLREQDPHIGD